MFVCLSVQPFENGKAREWISVANPQFRQMKFRQIKFAKWSFTEINEVRQIKFSQIKKVLAPKKKYISPISI